MFDCWLKSIASGDAGVPWMCKTEHVIHNPLFDGCRVRPVRVTERGADG
jgi:hypothetical protein